MQRRVCVCTQWSARAAVGLSVGRSTPALVIKTSGKNCCEPQRVMGTRETEPGLLAAWRGAGEQKSQPLRRWTQMNHHFFQCLVYGCEWRDAFSPVCFNLRHAINEKIRTYFFFDMVIFLDFSSKRHRPKELILAKNPIVGLICLYNLFFFEFWIKKI